MGFPQEELALHEVGTEAVFEGAESGKLPADTTTSTRIMSPLIEKATCFYVCYKLFLK